MKIELDVPTWYSRESMYASKVKSTDIFLDSVCVDLSKADVNLHPTEEDLQTILPSVSVLLAKETESWFSSPLTADQVQKRLKCQFSPVPCDTEERWVKATWTPSYFQVLKKGFVLIFNLFKITSCNPRIPLTFFEAMTPRAGSPTDEGSVEVRNIVLQPGAGPRDLEDIDDIPLSENLTSFEIRDDQARERHKFRQAKLRAAIARLKVEEMRERYLRHYGTEYLEESSDSEDEDSSQGSELSEPVHKK
jgi:hypothetical protein